MPETSRPTPPSSATFMDPTLMPWALVSEVYWMSWKLLERRLYHLGVSASQARVLSVLYFSEAAIKPSAIATLLFLETQSITGIHHIEARGWVQRTPDPNDRRAVGLGLTGAGRKLTEEIVEISKGLYAEFFASALTTADKRQLEALLKRVRAVGFKLPETDFKLRRAQQYPIWKD
jgi:DNA-binding MarR family transcriptional regulator